MARETIAQSVSEWERASQRERSNGNVALAITFSNMAWLLEHRDRWIPRLTPSATQQAINYLNEWDDIT
jgi:hypothetical protein